MVYDLPAEAVMLVIDFLYLITGCLSFENAVAGFGNTGVLTVVFLSIVSSGPSHFAASEDSAFWG